MRRTQADPSFGEPLQSAPTGPLTIAVTTSSGPFRSTRASNHTRLDSLSVSVVGFATCEGADGVTELDDPFVDPDWISNVIAEGRYHCATFRRTLPILSTTGPGRFIYNRMSQ
jgi:hypothetical protein